MSAPITTHSTDRQDVPILGTGQYGWLSVSGRFGLLGATDMAMDCEMSGLTAIRAGNHVETVEGRPRVAITRRFTILEQHSPPATAVQNPFRETAGYLEGDHEGGVEALLPGRITYFQYLLLKVGDVMLANREPIALRMEDIQTWPVAPGTRFHQIPFGDDSGPGTYFYDVSGLPSNALATLDFGSAVPVAYLNKCGGYMYANAEPPF